jgi:hypothetical protein
LQKHKTKVGSLFSKWTFLVFQEMSKSYKPQQSLAKGGKKQCKNKNTTPTAYYGNKVANC